MNGHSINSDLARARDGLGICPQYNVLWDRLTVAEHLWLTASLKVRLPTCLHVLLVADLISFFFVKWQ